MNWPKTGRWVTGSQGTFSDSSVDTPTRLESLTNNSGTDGERGDYSIDAQSITAPLRRLPKLRWISGSMV